MFFNQNMIDILAIMVINDTDKKKYYIIDTIIVHWLLGSADFQ